MTRGVVRTLDLISSAGVLCSGGWLIYASLLNGELSSKVYEFVRNRPLSGAAIGCFLILSVVLRFVSGRKRSAKTSFIDFQSDDGSVGISTKAIQDFIVRVGKEFTAIKSIESQLIQDKGVLDIAISMKVLSGNKIPELSQVLQQRIRESVRESLGLEEIRNITIKVAEIVGEPAKHVESEDDEK